MEPRFSLSPIVPSFIRSTSLHGYEYYRREHCAACVRAREREREGEGEGERERERGRADTGKKGGNEEEKGVFFLMFFSFFFSQTQLLKENARIWQFQRKTTKTKNTGTHYNETATKENAPPPHPLKKFHKIEKKLNMYFFNGHTSKLSNTVYEEWMISFFYSTFLSARAHTHTHTHTRTDVLR